VFEKTAGGKKIPFPGLTRSDVFDNEFRPSGNLPPLMESPYRTSIDTQAKLGPSRVSCFSNPMDTSIAQTTHDIANKPSFDGFMNANPYNSFGSVSNPTGYFPRIGGVNPVYPSQMGHFTGNYIMSEQHILRAILKTHGAEMKQSMKTEGVNYSASQDTGLSSDMNAEISSVVSNYDMPPRPFDDPDCPSTSGGPVDLDVLWNY